MIVNTSISSQFKENYSILNQSIKANDQEQSHPVVAQQKLQLSTDQVHLTYTSTTVGTYDNSLSVADAANDGYDLLRGFVKNMFKAQGIDAPFNTDDGAIDIAELSPEKAQELIDDNGYFGIEKTSERIVRFATGLAGGDPTKIDAIRQGIDDGFQQALNAFGGKLPDISYDTYDTVMQKLDEWANIDTTDATPPSQTQVKS